MCDDIELLILPDLPTKINTVNCSFNKLEKLPQLHHISPNGDGDKFDTFEFDCSYNLITEIPELPSIINTNLVELNFNFKNNKITSINRDFPMPPEDSILNVDCSYNQITTLPLIFNNSLGLFNCSNNSIIILPDFKNIIQLNCSCNKIIKLSKLPLQNMSLLDCSNNLINVFPDISELKNDAFLNTSNNININDLISNFITQRNGVAI